MALFLSLLFIFSLVCTATSSSAVDLKAKIFGREPETDSILALKEKVLSGEQDGQCGPGQVFLTCATPCMPTCENQALQVCQRTCVRGCFCASGTLLRKDGACVPPEQCALVAPCLPARCPRPNCPSDQAITPAGACCPVCRGTPTAPLCRRGERPVSTIDCRTQSCPSGSECYVDPADTFAVCCSTSPPGLIPAPAPVCEGEGATCGGYFGTPCPKDLRCVDDPNDFCDPNMGGADCPGICKCPNCKGENQQCGGFAGTRCPADLTCVDAPGDSCDPLTGGADCPGVCQCPTVTPCPMIKCATPKDGCYYVNRRKDKNGCVVNCGVQKCDKPRCPAPMEWKECASECSPTCGPQPSTCPDSCLNGCFCPPGLLKNGDASCVTADKCPVVTPVL